MTEEDTLAYSEEGTEWIPSPDRAELNLADIEAAGVPIDHGNDDVDDYGLHRIPTWAQGFITAGHGFLVETHTELPNPSKPCKYCGGPLYPVAVWVCQCTGEDFTPATDINCQCNWCTLNRAGMHPGSRGRPRVHCGKPECRKAQRKAENRRAYERRKKSAV